jgi:predicted MPP superfamily phosphohydrolase
MQRLIPIIIIWFLVDIYFFQAVRTVTNNRYIHWAYWLYDGLLLAIILFYFLTYSKGISPGKGIGWLIGLILISFLPKLIIIPVLLLEDIGRAIYYTANWIIHLFKSSAASDSVIHYPDRRTFISQIALGIAAIPFFSLIYGMIKGKYDYKVHKIVLKFKDLPEAFDGFTITQLSDIHSGSFDSKSDVERGIALANKQKGDLMLFTGDLVNSRADEMNEWIDTFSKLRAPFGQFSILGNHDYGDYVQWDNDAAKAKNLQQLKDVHKTIGFTLLLDQHVRIEKDGQSITLIGVENWGKRGFHQYGNLKNATKNIDDTDFKILMSHDPSHWEGEILDHPKYIHLTLSGHTHGMQFGIEIPGLKWSPVKYIYPQWAGIYRKNDKYINVNRGFGFIGYPGRVGILPEISVIELRKES